MYLGRNTFNQIKYNFGQMWHLMMHQIFDDLNSYTNILSLKHFCLIFGSADKQQSQYTSK